MEWLNDNAMIAFAMAIMGFLIYGYHRNRLELKSDLKQYQTRKKESDQFYAEQIEKKNQSIKKLEAKNKQLLKERRNAKANNHFMERPTELFATSNKKMPETSTGVRVRELFYINTPHGKAKSFVLEKIQPATAVAACLNKTLTKKAEEGVLLFKTNAGDYIKPHPNWIKTLSDGGEVFYTKGRFYRVIDND